MNIINIILAVFIILAVVSYLYFKTKQFRTALPIRKKWYQNRAGQSLGAFVMLFGINQIVLYQSAITIIVCIIFIALGSLTIAHYSKRVKHYGQFIKEEAALNQ
ncbi:YtpI family protein [Kurthia sibirica]|uniref:YtpI-like protein n=1 Tax=Kurthia sibirica TaxID=202750 RepID=A0A2U3ANT9_9BACL|nr:YtpI family protein [Kurthia sibirica]PWI26202.1 hypothetical protein DEX24_04555 [Kurthia sibirica]GEK34715.1 hypothetical protein KSI01_22480 [Kurthia sibirica]